MTISFQFVKIALESITFKGKITLKIGNVLIDGPAMLAPLAGVADRAMRELCLDYGAAGVTTEMVSAKGFTMGDPKSAELLTIHEKEQPCAIQLFGYSPEIVSEGAKKAVEYGPAYIDINMGCPAPKIVGNKGGSSLLKDPDLAVAIAEATVKAIDLPVTVKMRTGWDNDSIVCVDLAKRLEDVGVAAITVHGRTREQMYAPPVNINAIAEVKKAVSIPVIANGDVIDGPTAARLFEETNCDAVMIGRGAQGRPWVFQQVNAFMNEERIIPEPPVSERMRVMLKHAELICSYKGEYVGMREARKHASWYIRGVRGAAQFRNSIGTLSTMEELAELAMKVIEADAKSNR